jgi:hypothetical protein
MRAAGALLLLGHELTAPFRGKTGEGRVSTEVIASILELPGRSFISETDVLVIVDCVLALSTELALIADIVRLNIEIEFLPRRRGRNSCFAS